MDDIYFSDKKKKPDSKNAYQRRTAKDKFIDSDYKDETFELNLKKKGNAQAFYDKKKDFKVKLPDFDVDIPEPGHITPPSKDLYSSAAGRTPQGRRMAQGSAANNKPRQKPEPASEQRPKGASPQRTPSGQRVARSAPSAGRQPQGRPPVNRQPQGRPVKKKTSSRGRGFGIAAGIIGLIVIFIAGAFLYGYSALGGLEYDSSIKENTYVDESTLLHSDTVRNILFIGSDARDGLAGQRSDSMILFSIDEENKQIKLTSFLRDSYVYIPSKGYYTKLNAAFNYGGAQLLLDTLEYNFGVRIDEYLMVNYEVFIELVDLLGGITIPDVTAKEAKFMRDEVNRKSFKEGDNHVDGRTAMWYCRIRYLDSDFNRTQRQRKVLTAIISKATKTNPFTLVDIVKQVLPNISTNIDRNELMKLGVGALLKYMRYDIVQQQIPAEGTWSDAMVYGQAVLKLNFTENKKILKEFIYEE